MRKIVVALALIGALVFGWAGTAMAHVTVDPPSTPQGGTVKLSFLAPNEEPPASVTELQIFFPVPPQTPIPTVTVEPKAGWTFHLTIQHLAKPIVTDDGSIAEIVNEIDWKADNAAAAIGPNEFGEFTIDADGLPTNENQVVFKALQTYSNNQIVRWIDPVTPGAPEPAHPTPILQLTNPNGSPATSATSTTATASIKDNSARAIAITALIVGILALLAAGTALVRKRRVA
ncbi:MAG: YcnI family protein [Acidimicrobiia bacterium]